MSEESIINELTNPELQELETSLRSFSAAGNVNRDELLFEAGRRSATGRSGSRSGIWKGVSTVLALLLVGQSILFWSNGDRHFAENDSAADHSAIPETESPTRNVHSPDARITEHTDFATQHDHPTQRSRLLELRRVALARGVDAAFATDTDNPDHSSTGLPTQRELLRELLGS